MCTKRMVATWTSSKSGKFTVELETPSGQATISVGANAIFESEDIDDLIVALTEARRLCMPS